MTEMVTEGKADRGEPLPSSQLQVSGPAAMTQVTSVVSTPRPTCMDAATDQRPRTARREKPAPQTSLREARAHLSGAGRTPHAQLPRMHSTAFPHTGALWNYLLRSLSQQEKSSPNSRSFPGGRFNRFLWNLARPSQCPPPFPRFFTAPSPNGKCC